MARKKTDNPFPDCIRVREPNKEKLAELVLKAKGENRSISAFARECEVSTSTLSRLINKETSKANSDDLILAIAEKANPESGVTLEALLDAHGLERYIIPGNHNITYTKFGPLVEGKYFTNLSNYYGTLKKRAQWDGEDVVHVLRIVTERIFQLKKSKKLSENVEIGTNLKAYTRDVWKMYQWERDTQKKKKSWQFYVQPSNERLFETLKKFFGELYLTDMPECKSSIITVREGEFNAIRLLFKNRKIKDCVSIILVDLETDEVVDEFQFPMLQEWDKKWMLK